MTIVSNNLHGDFQLANGYGHVKAKQILEVLSSYPFSILTRIAFLNPFEAQEHRNKFITIDDFYFLSRHGINTVRIPVGWWIAFDPDPPTPFIGGSLTALDRAFSWAQ